MINVIASIHIKEGRRSEFIDIFKSNIQYVLEEKGCKQYVPAIDVPNAGAFCASQLGRYAYKEIKR